MRLRRRWKQNKRAIDFLTYRSSVKSVELTFDLAKRLRTLAERGLDFGAAGEVFVGIHATIPDDRRDYGEARLLSAGFLNGRLVVIVWTWREAARPIISMRHAHEAEYRRWRQHLDRPG